MNNSYLLELCRYIVLNPVRAGMVKGPAQWRWSSYRALAGRDRPLGCLSSDWVLGQFGSRRGIAEKKYVEFVKEGMRAEKPWGGLSEGGMVLGDEGFLAAVRRIIRGKRELQEVPRAQRFDGRKPLGALIDSKGKYGDRELYNAYMEHGYRMNQIARHLGVHYSTVSRAIKRVESA